MILDRRAQVLALLAAAAAALLLQLLHLSGRPLWLDESWSRWMVEQDWAGLRDSAERYDTHPPVYYSLLKLWSQLAPATPLGLRLLSVAAALTLLPIGWLCARRISKLRNAPWAPLLVVAMLAVSPALIVAARQARPYALFALVFAVALCAALSLVREEPRRRRAAAWTAYLIGFELLLWLHALGILFAASLAGSLLLALWLCGTLRRDWVPFVAVHVAAAAAWLPGLLMILEQRRAWTGGWLRFHWIDVPPGLAQGLAAPGLIGWLIILLAVLGAGALLKSRTDRPAAFILVVTAAAPAILAILLSVLSTPVFLPRTLVPSVLPIALLAAAGVLRLDGRALRASAAAALLALPAAASFAQISRPPEERWDQLNQWLDARVGEGEEVWLLPNELILPLRYARAGEPGYRVRGIPADFPAGWHVGPRYSGTAAVPGMTAQDSARLVEEARRRGLDGVWIVYRFPRLFDPENNLRTVLPEAGSERFTSFAPLLVVHYRL